MRPLSIARLATLVGISTHLKSLSLKSCGLDDVSFQTLCERFPMTKRLQKIDFTDNQITDVSIENGFTDLILCALKPPLTHIIFTQNKISGKGGEALFTCLIESKTVEHVSLAENKINDEFAIWLQRFLKEART